MATRGASRGAFNLTIYGKLKKKALLALLATRACLPAACAKQPLAATAILHE